MLGLELLLRLRLVLLGRLGGGAEGTGGGGAGGHPLFMFGSNPKRVTFTNPAKSRRVEINNKNTAGQKTKIIRDVTVQTVANARFEKLN